MIHLPHRTKFDPKSSVFKVSHSRGGWGGLNLNETLSPSNGKLVFDHGPNKSKIIKSKEIPMFLNF